MNTSVLKVYPSVGKAMLSVAVHKVKSTSRLSLALLLLLVSLAQIKAQERIVFADSNSILPTMARYARQVFPHHSRCCAPRPLPKKNQQ